jgi:hypothetical protein
VPYESASWRPLTDSEIEDAIKRIQSLVDAGTTPAPEDHARNFQNEVTTALSDTGGYTWHEVRKIMDRLLLEHFVDGAPIRYYRTFSYAADVTRQQGLRYLDAPEWDQAMLVLLRALKYSLDEEATITAARLSRARIAAQAEAIKRLRDRGFTIGFYGVNVVIAQAEQDRLYGLAISEATARGGAFLFNYLGRVLQPFCSQEFQRYVVNLNVQTSPPKAQPSWPLRYRYNLAAKIASLGTVPGTETMPDAEYDQFLVDICAVHSVEPYNWAEVSVVSGTLLLELLGDLGKVKSMFVLPQLDEREITKTLRGVFSWIDFATETKLGWTLDQAIEFCEAVISNLPQQATVCIPKDVLQKQLPHFAPEVYEALWAVFVHAPGAVNTDFIDPTKDVNVNVYFKPLIGFADKSVVGLPSVSATGWYEAIATALRDAGIGNVEQKIGDAFEPFVRDLLAPYGTVYSGTFTSANGDGDVDAAIATDSTIILFELKRKALTRIAQSGDIIGVMIDLVKSFVKAQTQLAKIEYVLRADGSLMLGSSTLDLRGRKVKRVVLSWHDYGVFHDHSFLRNFLQNLAGQSIAHSDPTRASEVSQINWQLGELADWENKIVGTLAGQKRIAFNACFFYAIDHLLAMMRSASTDEQLCQHLTYNEYIGSVALDFYVEYGKWLRDILPHLPPPT